MPKVLSVAGAEGSPATPAPTGPAAQIEAPNVATSSKGAFGIKPKEIPFAPSSYADKYTGRRVTRIFPAGQQACHAYFTSTSYDADERLLLSAQVDGRYQLVRADLHRGTLQCLTGLPPMRAQSFCVSPAKNLAIVNDAGNYVRVDLETGECKTILSAPKGFRLGLPTVDAAGKRIAFVVAQRHGRRSDHRIRPVRCDGVRQQVALQRRAFPEDGWARGRQV